MVIEWMGYKDSKDTMGDFYKNLQKNYEIDVDYLEVDQNNELVKMDCSSNFRSDNIKGGQNKKYYLVTGECLKTLLMSAQTVKAKMVKKIYIKTEQLVFIMLEVINKQQLMIKDMELKNKELELQKKDKLLEDAKNRSLDLESEIKNVEKLKNDGYIYIATTKQYSLNNTFRLGKTENLNRRMQSYELSRVKNDMYYYVFVYESANTSLLETILTRFLKKYKENSEANKDIFILPFYILKSFVENICKIFNEEMISNVNNMVEANIDFIYNRGEYDTPTMVQPYLYSRNKDTYEEVLSIKPDYYEQIYNLYKIYPGIEIKTPRENIHTMHDMVDIVCPHSRREILVRTLLNSLGCPDCVKDKALEEKTKEIFTDKLDNYDEYDIIEIMDTDNIDKVSEKKRITTQNRIVDKLKEENLVLLTSFKNYDSKIAIMCEFGHHNTTSYNALKKLQDRYCRTCRELKTEIKNASKKKQSTGDDIENLAKSLKFTNLGYTGKAGIIELKCPFDHPLLKTLREHKRGYCGVCKRNYIKNPI